MALISPGVEVTVVDESNYLPAATASVPFILFSTAQNKVSATGSGVAAGTTAANAGKVYLVSSQRELVSIFGNPFFYKTSNGTPIDGYELNEYGLMAAYSVLGVSNRAYVMRSDVDLAELTATVTRPTGNPDNNTYWLDLINTDWGIFEWNQSTGAFTNKSPIQITSTGDLDTGIPKDSIGNIGDYAVVTTNANNPVYFKDSANGWVLVGSDDWCDSWPAVQGAEANPTLINGNSIIINGSTVTLSGTNLASLVSAINNAAITGVTAVASALGKLELYADTSASSDGSTEDGIIEISNGTGNILTLVGIAAGTYARPALQQSPHTQVPRWRTSDTTPRPTGSVWHKTTAVNLGSDLVVKKFNSTLGVFVEQDAPLYENDQSALKALDPTTGGTLVPQGATYAQYDVSENDTFTVKIFERFALGQTIVTSDETSPVFVINETFTIQASAKNSNTLTAAVTATLQGTGAEDFVAAFLAANVENTTASVTADGAVQIRHTQGGVIVLKDTAGTPVADAGINTDLTNVRTGNNSDLILSNWVPLTYSASTSAPDQNPANGRKWYYSAVDQVDIMIHDGSAWKGYRNVSNDVRGFNLVNTDPNGPQVGASEPVEQSDETALVLGDLWIDTSDLENYPLIKRYSNVDGVNQWVTIDNTDQTTENGVLFADARWDTDGTVDPVSGALPTIKSLLTSNYLDPDAPDEDLYPAGTLLFNTRRSGFVVKEFRSDYFNAVDFPDISLPTQKNTWGTVSGNKSNGSPYMGRQAVRSIVVAAMKSAIDTSIEIREEQRQFNLIATPGYPELMVNMVSLNNERNNTAFVIGDTPLRLADDGNSLLEWTSNNSGLGVPTQDGLTITDSYMGVFYPSCQTTDLSGSTIVQPPSHMMLRTIIRSDEVAFPWLAPAGIRRGIVDNATGIGYINSRTGEFNSVSIGQGTRDTLYENRVNPITFIPGTGIVNYGNKTTQTAATALDRINVARLVAFVRGRLELIGKQFVFEPNDKITRDEIKNSIEGLMNDLLAKRGIYDYLVVCDTSNNTPDRIDRNELYVDVAIEPVKAVEFIYIPLRIQNTGEISGGGAAA
jgi:hypothetical protein